jgi:hypothetical protein
LYYYLNLLFIYLNPLTTLSLCFFYFLEKKMTEEVVSTKEILKCGKKIQNWLDNKDNGKEEKLQLFIDAVKDDNIQIATILIDTQSIHVDEENKILAKFASPWLITMIFSLFSGDTKTELEEKLKLFSSLIQFDRVDVIQYSKKYLDNRKLLYERFIANKKQLFKKLGSFYAMKMIDYFCDNLPVDKRLHKYIGILGDMIVNTSETRVNLVKQFYLSKIQPLSNNADDHEGSLSYILENNFQSLQLFLFFVDEYLQVLNTLQALHEQKSSKYKDRTKQAIAESQYNIEIVSWILENWKIEPHFFLDNGKSFLIEHVDRLTLLIDHHHHYLNAVDVDIQSCYSNLMQRVFCQNVSYNLDDDDGWPLIKYQELLFRHLLTRNLADKKVYEKLRTILHHSPDFSTIHVDSSKIRPTEEDFITQEEKAEKLKTIQNSLDLAKEYVDHCQTLLKLFFPSALVNILLNY